MAKKYRKEQQQKAPLVKVEQKSAPPTPPKPTIPTTASSPRLSQTSNIRGEQGVALPATATLQQRRAHFALTRIRPLTDEWKEDAKKQKEFNSYASAMPFMIHANGLGQTAAFYRRKGPEHTYYRLYALLGDWLSQTDQPFAGQPDLLEGITQSDMDTYLAAQVEAMLFLDWVKKLASAFLAREEEVST
jgi:CRISPR-associated protein Cmr5